MEKGETVVAHSYHGELKALKGVENAVKIVNGDIRDVLTLGRIIREEGVRVLVHTARLVGRQYASLEPGKSVRADVDAFADLLELARMVDLERIVYTSSIVVYGEGSGRVLAEEDAPVVFLPTDAYRLVKLVCEWLGSSYKEKYGIEFVSLRLSYVYGPGLEFKTVVNRLEIVDAVIDAVEGRVVRIPTGRTHKDWVYVKDVAEAISLACRARGLKHDAFNVGSGKASGPLDLSDAFKECFPSLQVELQEDRSDPLWVPESKRESVALDMTRSRMELGFAPRYDLSKGIRDYADWLRSSMLRR